MPADEHDAGLDQRLPWGRLRPQPARRMRRTEAPAIHGGDAAPGPAPPEPEPLELEPPEPELAVAGAPAEATGEQEHGSKTAESEPPAAASVGDPPEPPAAMFDGSGDLQRSIEVLLVVLEGRMDRLEERMDLQGALVPAFLDEIETHIRDQQSAVAEESRKQIDVLRRELDERLDAVAADLKDQLERLQRLTVASHTSLIDAIEGLAAVASELKAGDPALNR